MKEITLTCPFTGCEFTALEDLDKNIYFKHPLTGEDLRINYNRSIKKYNMPRKFFKHVETVDLAQAAEILDVTKQRISTIAMNNVIKPKNVNGKTVFLLSDVLEYKKNRKVGAPKKIVDTVNN